MTYAVHKIFRTIQGEGRLAGRPAVFVRFTGCNLWTGHERDREKAVCKFCDTDFVGGERMTAQQIVEVCRSEWGEKCGNPLIVLTGGEPALQWDEELNIAMREAYFFVAIETNGTVGLRASVNWKCVSPKADTQIVEDHATELKFVYPQDRLTPQEARDRIVADHYTLMPMDGPQIKENTASAIEYVLTHSGWRLGIQAHKHWGIQ